MAVEALHLVLLDRPVKIRQPCFLPLRLGAMPADSSEEIAGKKALGTAIQSVREYIGASRREVEEEGGLGRGTLRRVELGKEVPRVGTVRKIAEGIGVGIHVVYAELEKAEAASRRRAQRGAA